MKKIPILLVLINLTKLITAQCDNDLNFCDGNYYFNESIVISENQKIKGTGNTNLYFSCNTGLITDYAIDAADSILVDAQAYNNYVNSNIQCEDGDILYLSGENNELMIVDSSSNGIVYFKDRISFDYIAGDLIQKREYLRGIEIEGVNIYMQGNINDVGMSLRGCRDIKISNVKIYNATWTGIYTYEWYGGIIENSFISNNTTSGYGYGIAICDASYYVNVQNNNIEKSKHCITFGGNKGTNRFCNIIDNHVIGSEVGSGICMDTHENTEYITFSRNTVKGGLVGFNSRGSYITISNNIIHGSRKGYESNTGINNIVRNNQFYNCDYSITVDNSTASIIDNEIVSFKSNSQGIGIGYGSNASDYTTLITGNKITTNACIYFRDEIENVIIEGNQLFGIGASSDGVVFITSDTSIFNENLIIKNNTFNNFYNALEFWGNYKYANIQDNIVKNSNTLIYVNETRGDCNYFDVQNNFIEVENFTNDANTSNWTISNKWINN